MGHRTSRRRRGNDAEAADAESEPARSTEGQRRPDTDRAAAERGGTTGPGLAVDRSETTDSGDRDGERRVAYDPGSDAGTLGERYGLEVGRREAGRLQRLEAEFGPERVQRWADEGIPVEAMGKPRDMAALRSDSSGGSGPSVQPKLEVSDPDDPAEKEAEQVAEAVVEANGAGAAGREGHETPPEDAARSGGGGSVPSEAESTVRDGIRGDGKPLPAEVRSSFESELGADLSDVRVHTGASADEAARSIHAEAYTLGSDIAFAEGRYNPDSKGGRKLLAHELTHVVQQSGAGQAEPTRRASSERVHRGLLGDAVSGVKNAAESAAESASQAVEDVKDTAESAAESAGQAVEDAKQAGQSAVEGAKEAGESALESAGQAVGSIKQAGQSALQQAGQAVGALAEDASNVGNQVWNVLERGGKEALGVLQRSRDAVVNMVRDGGQRAWNVLKRGGEQAWNVLRSGGQEVWNVMQNTGQRLWNTLRQNGELLVNALRKGGPGVWDVLRQGGRQAWNAIRSGGQEVWNVLQERGGQLWNVLRENGQILVGMLRNGGQRAWNILRRGGRRLWDVVRNTGGRIWSVLRGAGHRLWTLLQENTQFLVDTVVQGGRRAWEVLRSGGQRLWNAIRNGGRQVWAALQRVGTRFWEFLEQSGTLLWSFLERGGQWVWNVLSSVRHLLWDFIRETPERLLRVLRHLGRAAAAVPQWFVDGIRRLFTDPSSLGAWLREGLESAAIWTGQLLTRLLDLVGFGEALDLLSEFFSINSRGLTSTEVSEAGTVLGGAVDYDQVRVDESSIISTIGAEIRGEEVAVTTFHTLHFDEPLETSAGSAEMALLIHELSHVAQYEAVGSQYMPEAIHAQTAGAGYEYSYEELTNESFSYFNREQQASIIQDFYGHVENDVGGGAWVTSAPDDLFENYESEYAGAYEPHIEAIRGGNV